MSTGVDAVAGVMDMTNVAGAGAAEMTAAIPAVTKVAEVAVPAVDMAGAASIPKLDVSVPKVAVESAISDVSRMPDLPTEGSQMSTAAEKQAADDAFSAAAKAVEGQSANPGPSEANGATPLTDALNTPVNNTETAAANPQAQISKDLAETTGLDSSVVQEYLKEKGIKATDIKDTDVTIVQDMEDWAKNRPTEKPTSEPSTTAGTSGQSSTETPAGQPIANSAEGSTTPPKATAEVTPPATEKPAPKSTIARQTEVNKKIEDLENQGDSRTAEQDKELQTLLSNKAELDEFASLEHRKKYPDNSTPLTKDEEKRFDTLDRKLNPKEATGIDDNAGKELETIQQELRTLQEDIASGKLSPSEAAEKMNANFAKRESLVKSLVDRLASGDKNLSTFEKEVAETANEMQQYMYQVMAAPEIVKQMETVLRGIKSKFKEASSFKITKENINTDLARKNVAERAAYARQIASQATHMAEYGDVVRTSLREFRSSNSKLMRLVGARGLIHDMVVQVGTGIMKTIDSYSNDIDARYIAQTGQVPTWDTVR